MVDALRCLSFSCKEVVNDRHGFERTVRVRRRAVGCDCRSPVLRTVLFACRLSFSPLVEIDLGHTGLSGCLFLHGIGSFVPLPLLFVAFVTMTLFIVWCL